MLKRGLKRSRKPTLYSPTLKSARCMIGIVIKCPVVHLSARLAFRQQIFAGRTYSAEVSRTCSRLSLGLAAVVSHHLAHVGEMTSLYDTDASSRALDLLLPPLCEPMISERVTDSQAPRGRKKLNGIGELLLPVRAGCYLHSASQ